MDTVTDILLRALERVEREHPHILKAAMRSRSQLTSSTNPEEGSGQPSDSASSQNLDQPSNPDG